MKVRNSTMAKLDMYESGEIRRYRYKWDAEYRENRKLSSKKYYDKVKNSPEFRAKAVARAKKWRQDNPDKVRAYARTDKQREYRRNYEKAHRAQRIISPEKREEYRVRAKERVKELAELTKKILADPAFAKTLPQEMVTKLLARRERRLQRCRAYYKQHSEAILSAQREARDKDREHYRKLARESYHRCMRRKVLAGHKSVS